MSETKSSTIGTAIWSTWALLLGFGILIELLQSQIPYRTAEFADAAFDTGGILLGWFLAGIGLSRWTAWLENLLPEPSQP